MENEHSSKQLITEQKKLFVGDNTAKVQIAQQSNETKINSINLII